MITSSIRRRVDATPFCPFEIRIADGVSIPVHHREFTMISPADFDFVVYRPDGGNDIVATNLITGLQLKALKSRSLGNK